MTNYNFTGKTVVITGGTKGIGKAIAEAFAECHANVVVSSRNQGDCDRVASALRREKCSAEGIAADVQHTAEVERLIADAVCRYGRIDVLVNCAGVAVTKKLLDLEEEDYDRVMDTNLKSVLFASRAAAREMVKQGDGGKIIQIASIGGVKGSNGLSVYGASKAAVMNLTKTMALEWSRYGICVNAICPGYVVTELNAHVLENEKTKDKMLREIPQRRFGSVEEVAAIALFLATDAANMIQGESIVADMGTTCK